MIPEIFRPSPKYPTYPPYHQGDYLEDHFYKWSLNQSFQRIYIPVFWTSVYCNPGSAALRNTLQVMLNRLPRGSSYFTVCQHDDAPREFLPPDTMVFSSGGHFDDKPLIPLPSICSPIPNPVTNRKRDIFCSFIGSMTHPIRQKLIDVFQNKPDCVLKGSSWNPSISQEQFQLFKNTTERSEFCFVPRGYGKSSFRMYEAMQLGAIPVYISDSHFLPWKDELNWQDLCVIVHENEIDSLYDRLHSYTDSQKNLMRQYAQQVYGTHFSLNGVCRQIQKRVNNT